MENYTENHQFSPLVTTTSPGQDYKLPTVHSLTLNEPTMSKQVMISMLRQGNTGSDILSILDVIAGNTISEGNDDTQTATMPTLEEIEF